MMFGLDLRLGLWQMMDSEDVLDAFDQPTPEMIDVKVIREPRGSLKVITLQDFLHVGLTLIVLVCRSFWLNFPSWFNSYNIY